MPGWARSLEKPLLPAWFISLLHDELVKLAMPIYPQPLFDWGGFFGVDNYGNSADSLNPLSDFS